MAEIFSLLAGLRLILSTDNIKNRDSKINYMSKLWCPPKVFQTRIFDVG